MSCVAVVNDGPVDKCDVTVDEEKSMSGVGFAEMYDGPANVHNVTVPMDVSNELMENTDGAAASLNKQVNEVEDEINGSRALVEESVHTTVSECNGVDDNAESEVNEDVTNDVANNVSESRMGGVSMDERDFDLQEKEKVELFLQKGCGCALFNGKPCSSLFTNDHISSIRDQCQSMERPALNNILLGHIMATVRTSTGTIKVRHPSSDRKRNTTSFLHEGNKVIN